MKKQLLTIGFVGLALFSIAQKSKDKKVILTNEIDSVSYLIGVSVGNNIGKEMSEANIELIIQGFRDAVNQKTLACNDDGNAILQQYFTNKAGKVQAQEDKKNEVFKGESEKFLIDNLKNPEIKMTSSGLQYMILKEGSGDHPKAESTVKVHYHGTTIEGKVFDSSVDRGEPIEFPLNQVIKGWTEGLQLMAVGSKFKFFIPQELAYGAQSPSPEIKPYSTLIFEVELLSFEDPK
jgi:FKBP-type peptidyl-prolyl cis-trans isomerase FklB